MTQGRDPARFLFTFGKWRGQYIEDVAKEANGMDELYEYMVFAQGEKEPGPSLEVAGEMIEAFLLDREFTPKPKYKSPRRVK